MKVLLCVLLLSSFYAQISCAEENKNSLDKEESEMSIDAKKLLRKVGRKSLDETCEMTKGLAQCEKEKLEHIKGAEADQSDTEKRILAKKMAKAEKMLKQHNEEKDCHETNGKIQCVGKKIKNKIENIVD